LVPSFDDGDGFVGLAVHVKGFGLALVSATKRLMAACRSIREWKTPRFNRRRIDIEPDNVAQLGDEVRIVRELELSEPMRLEPARLPDMANRTGGSHARKPKGIPTGTLMLDRDH
jgi:hypothetical protein